MKKTIRFISFCLCIVMLMQLCTYVTMADADETASPSMANEQEQPTVVGEIVEKREANVKHFLNSDQTVTACVYPQSVHYKNENGAYQEIDNTLSYDATDGETGYVNASNSIKVKFSKKAKPEKIASIRIDGQKITWGLIGASKVRGKINNAGDTDDTDDHSVAKVKSSIIYRNILPNTDIEYITVGQAIKENIILKDKNAQDAFVFSYNTGKAEMQLKDNKLHIVYNDTDLLMIEAPVMTDADGESSTDIALSLETIKDVDGNHRYHVIVQPSAEWLDSEERVYPVVVDPSTQTPQEYNDIADTYISKEAPNSNFTTEPTFKVGMNTTSKCYRSFLRFTLPNIGKSDRVVGATLSAYPSTTASDLTTMAQQRPIINVYGVNETWDCNTINWNNRPSVNSTPTDYDIIEAENGNQLHWYQWDITDIAENWYATGENNGVMLMYDNEQYYGSNMVMDFISTSGGTAYQAGFPLVSISYMNMLGLEDYWTYHTIDMGCAGNAYINDFTGTVTTVTPIASVASERCPIDISLIYSPGSNDASINSLSVGNGFMLNVQSYIKPVVIGGNTKYKYVDADGTIHYFEQQNAKWKDDSGLGLELTITSGYYYIKDKKDNCLTFYADTGRLCKISDSCNNNIMLYYNHPAGSNEYYLDHITNNDKTITFIRNGSRLDRVEYPDENGNHLRYAQIMYTEYNNNIYHLSQYVYGENAYKATDVVSFISNGQIITGIISCPYDKGNPPNSTGTNLTGSAVLFNYTSVNDDIIRRRVIKYRECPYIGSGSYGDNKYEVNITYRKRTTKYSMIPPGGNQNSERSVLYTFNRYGQTVMAKDVKGNTIYQAQGIAGGSKNKVTFESNSQRSVTNLLKNHNFEKVTSNPLQDWPATVMGNDGAAMKGPAEGEPTFIGNKAAKLYKHSNSQARQPRIQQQITLQARKKYTMSVYIYTQFTEYGSIADPGAYFGVENNSVNLQVFKSGISSQNGFARYYVTIDLSDRQEDVTCNVVLGIKKAEGIAYFDAVQLEEGDAVNSYNAVENAGFENTADTISWVQSNIGSYGSVSGSYKRSGNYGFGIVGDPKLARQLHQTIPVNGKKGDGLTAGVWLKSNCAPDKDTQNDGTKQSCGITMELCRSSGSSQFVTEKIDLSNGEWICISVGAIANFNYTNVKLYLKFNYNCNSVCFDDVNLFFDTFGQSYVYDDNGNMVSAADRANSTKNITHNGNNDAASYKDGMGNTYTFEYDNGDTTAKKHLLTKATAPNGCKSEITYNNYGQPTQNTTTSTGGMVMKSATTYSSGGRSVATETSITGAVTTYETDPNTGRINSVTAPDAVGNEKVKTEYTYDPLTKELTDVGAETITTDSANVTTQTRLPISITYDYNKGKLKEITRKDDNTKKIGYHFVYDDFDRQTAVQWSGADNVAHNLQTTQYYDYLSLPKKVTYGNGQQISYKYNSSNQLTQKEYAASSGASSEVVAKYEYNANNNLGAVTYNRPLTNKKETTHYFYDLAGRISGSNDTMGMSVGSVVYDKNNNTTAYLSGVKDDQINTAYNTLNTYDAMNLQTYLQIKPEGGYESGSIKYNYDGLGRMNAKGVTLDSSDNFLKTTYTYRAVTDADGQTLRTTLPSTTAITGTFGGVSVDTQYYTTYNADDSVKRQRITENGTPVYTYYYYDALSQLTGVTTGDDRYDYRYDNGGNLTSKTHNNMTSTYTYDSTLPDLLTSYSTVLNGTPTVRSYQYGSSTTGNSFINPTAINIYENGATAPTDTWDLTWREGRTLQSVATDSGTAEYEYNQDGLRIYRKATDGKKYYYYYNGSQLEYIKICDAAGILTNLLRYVYNSNGQAEYVLKITPANATNPKKYDLYYILRDNLGVITKLIQTRKTTSSSVTATLKVAAEYSYDPYGKCLTVNSPSNDSIASLNPLLYKDYLYDSDTDWYYLRSRYYDPEIGRFINADSQLNPGTGLTGFNLFAYCNNNPVNMVDPNGNFPFFVITAVVGAVVGAAVGGVIAAKRGGNVWAGIGIGAAAGGLIGLGVGAAASAVLAGSITATATEVVAGGAGLVSAISTGGLGAGATYIANNFSQATSSWAPATQNVASKMQEVTNKGKVGETLSGIIKNTAHIPSLTGTASYRIPDGLDKGLKILSEVKNYSGILPYTNQLKDFVMWSQANGYQMALYTNAKLTGPLQQVVDSGIIQLYPLG